MRASITVKVKFKAPPQTQNISYALALLRGQVSHRTTLPSTFRDQLGKSHHVLRFTQTLPRLARDRTGAPSPAAPCQSRSVDCELRAAARPTHDRCAIQDCDEMRPRDNPTMNNARARRCAAGT